MAAVAGVTQDEFVVRAREFLRSRIGSLADDLTADSELMQSGILDSLLVLEFFFFLEELRGSSIPEEKMTGEALSTIRLAYQLVVLE